MKTKIRGKIGFTLVCLLVLQPLMLASAFAYEVSVQFEPLSDSQSAVQYEAGSEEALEVLSTFPEALDVDIEGYGMQQVYVLEWVSDQPYDADVADTYVFTPILDDSVWLASLFEAMELPTITVELFDAELILLPATTAYDISAGPIVLSSADIDVVITGTYLGSSTGASAITAPNGYNGTITLAGVNIDVSANNFAAALTIEGSGSVANVTNFVNVVLQSGTTNTLISGGNRAGLEVNAGGQVTISGSGALIAECRPALSSEDSFGAGIGAGYRSSAGYLTGGNVVIMSGTITATAGYHGAGIGGSGYGSTPKYSGHVIIYGGNITANGGGHGAGIGGGCANRYGVEGTTGVLLVLPPAQISAVSAGNLASVGTMHAVVYIGDPAAPLVQVRTEDFTQNADIFMDLSNIPAIEAALIQTLVPVTDVNLHRILLGNTGSTGIAQINMLTHVSVAFWTEVISPAGTYYEKVEVVVDDDMTIVLPASDVLVSEAEVESPPPALAQAGDGQHVLALIAMGLLLSALLILLPIRLRAMKKSH
ncbi:MAG: carbohydrate-binding domain-containing protein [Coriobacteriia bacterium]|nr:carbohydrate-binding domain-containing protein [Coriobacteriia bacterium]MCL2750253.1 carbohydrate-binding domain-containing protein [Coriobacteriia bacterium]